MRHILLISLLFFSLFSYAREKDDSVSINFRQSSDRLDMDLSGNKINLDRIVKTISDRSKDSIYTIKHILVVGGASPEGSLEYNRGLSQRRANALFDYIGKYADLPDSVMEFRFLGRDWRGLARLVAHDYNTPFREETVALINTIANEAEKGAAVKVDPVRRLKKFKGGAPYQYMYKNLFPALRASKMYLTYALRPNPEKPKPVPVPVPEPEPEPIPEPEPVIVEVIEEPVTVVEDTVVVEHCKPFFMDVRSNMLYDAILIPNIGVEFYLGKNFSVAANWMYAWWKCDHKHNYWRTYGGDIEGRWWFGSKAHEKPLTGHHIGVYAQMLTYDFELGGRGYLGPKWSYGGGVSYGYSLPVAERINIDFSIGIGYLGGKYKEYLPNDDHYVWQSTKQRHWFGPTKAEISFVWLIGCDNKNIR